MYTALYLQLIVTIHSILQQLGVIIDEMCFDSLVKDIIKRTKSIFMSLMTLSRVSNGYSCASLRTLYMGLAQPHILHGCEFWGAMALGRDSN